MILEKLGLTKQEAKVYLGLLELQEAQTGSLCKHVGIHSSNIYGVLHNLMKKGLVSYRIQNNIKVFMASPPEALNELFLDKQRKLEEEKKEVNTLIANLKKKEVKEKPYSNYKYFEGIPAIKAMFHEINEHMSEGDIERLYASQKGSYEHMIGFYNLHHDIRNKKKIKARLIFPKGEAELSKKRKNQFTDIKFMDLKNKAEWFIVADRFVMQYTISKKPVAFMIQDKIFVDTFKQVFEQLWNE